MIKIVEVGPRDGLQNESATIPTETKVALVDALSGTGVGEIEVSAFVAPHKVPQLGDAGDVFRRIRRREGVQEVFFYPVGVHRVVTCVDAS